MTKCVYHFLKIEFHNQVTKETHSDGSIVEYEYGATDGFLTFIRSSSGENHTQFTYNQAKNKFSSHNSNGVISTYSYDRLGRKTRISVQDAANIYITNYSYDSLGSLDKLSDGGGNLIARYDHGIGLVNRTDASNNKAFYDFDGTGSTAALTGQAGNEINSYNYRSLRVKQDCCVLI